MGGEAGWRCGCRGMRGANVCRGVWLTSSAPRRACRCPGRCPGRVCAAVQAAVQPHTFTRHCLKRPGSQPPELACPCVQGIPRHARPPSVISIHSSLSSEPDRHSQKQLSFGALSVQAVLEVPLLLHPLHSGAKCLHHCRCLCQCGWRCTIAPPAKCGVPPPLRLRLQACANDTPW